jgi:dipeptidyl aminopeptidase/acylaminoacyl peptidase
VVSAAPGIARYGEWPSPLSVDVAAAASGGVSWPAASEARPDVTWWCASDPATATERLMRRDAAGARDVLGPEWSARNRYMGYGGRPFAVSGDDVVFTHHGDQRLYVLTLNEPPRPVTPADPPGLKVCYAEPQFVGNGSVLCLREETRDPTGPDDADPAPRTSRAIVAVALDGSDVREVARSHHFLANPRISPDGRRLAWIGWDHPLMPWDGTRLMVAELTDGVAGPARELFGADDVSVAGLEWAPDGTLLAMADPDGWWNLHRIDVNAGTAICVLPMEEECAAALWQVGASGLAALPDGRVVFRHGVGDQQLSIWSPSDGTLVGLAPEWTTFGGGIVVHAGTVVLTAASPNSRPCVLRVPLDGGAPTMLTDTTLAADLVPYLSVPQPRVLTGPDGRDIHVVFYPPTNPDVSAREGTLPPLLVYVHGGPTSRGGAAPDVQFSLFTSRGFAVVSVDYGGSTGYGRAYRERLRHKWGIVDRDDSVAAAVALADAGEVDRARMAIRGGSAGGWTALACLAESDVFCAGAVYFPVSDASEWSAGDTHDFESRYMFSLIGPPEDVAHYREVSPLTHVDSITAPLVMLQGADDFVCLPHHAQRVVDAVAARGLWHRLLIFEGEGHGFRKASSTRDSLLAEADLYSHAMSLAVDLSA